MSNRKPMPPEERRVRMGIFIKPNLRDKLEAESHRTGATMSRLIERAVYEYFAYGGYLTAGERKGEK